MTIAVSSVVKPSKLLKAAVAAMCFATVAAASAAVLGTIGASPLLSQAGAVAGGAFFAVLASFHLARNEKAWRVDISGTGQIRLGGKTSVRLLANSTLWPNLLLLRLQNEEGKIIVVPILPDSTSADDFRALSAALRWIALRRPDERRKIL